MQQCFAIPIIDEIRDNGDSDSNTSEVNKENTDNINMENLDNNIESKDINDISISDLDKLFSFKNM